MDRRAFLAGIGIASLGLSAGCLDDAPAERTNEDGGDGNGENDEVGNGKDEGFAGGFARYVSIAVVDGPPEEAPVEFDVCVTDDRVTAEGSAFLEITTENTDDSVRRVQSPYYKGSSARAGEPGILLYSLGAPDSPSEDYAPECIDDPESTREYHEFTDEGLPKHELRPGETATDRLMLVDDPTVGGCVPTGEYRFESTPVLFDDGRDPVEEVDPKWGFTLEIRDERSDG